MPKSSKAADGDDPLLDAILGHFDANRLSMDAAMRQLESTTKTIYAYLGMERPTGGKTNKREKLSKGGSGQAGKGS